MNVETIRDYCLSKKAATECMPFDDNTLVFKVLDKMFLLLNLNGELSIIVKCHPEKAIELREQHSAVLPGYHMNNKTLNLVMIVVRYQ
jgi:predicted DNA-binding protein (MmcQ/YjbR family)